MIKVEMKDQMPFIDPRSVKTIFECDKPYYCVAAKFLKSGLIWSIRPAEGTESDSRFQSQYTVVLEPGERSIADSRDVEEFLESISEFGEDSRFLLLSSWFMIKIAQLSSFYLKHATIQVDKKKSSLCGCDEFFGLDNYRMRQTIFRFRD